MKRILFILSLLVLALYSQAQEDESQDSKMNGVLKVEYQGFEKGTPVIITGIHSIKDDAQPSYLIGTNNISAIVGGKKTHFPFDTLFSVFEPVAFDTERFWKNEYDHFKMRKYYNKKGYRTSIRNELMADADEYINGLTGLFYKDDYIQDYIQSVFNGIIPKQLDRKRPEQLKIEILQSPNPDAYMLPNGTLLISTGMLSTLDSVEELTAILVSEVAHYALDHQVVNIAKERARVRRAEIWGVALAAVATGVEIALTENNENYIPGGLLITAGVAGEILTASAIDQLGMGYSDQQIYDGDDLAIKFLVQNNMQPTALGSALNKIKTYYKQANDKYALSRAGGYGNISQRIVRIGDIIESQSRSFQRRMSGVTTANAIMQLNSKNYKAAEQLAQKNIDNRLAGDEDYLILIKASMGYTNSPEMNRKNLEKIAEAKKISPVPNLGLYKQEILLLLRLDQEQEAAEALKRYMSLLVNFKQEVANGADTTWANEEIGWANRLYQQLRME